MLSHIHMRPWLISWHRTFIFFSHHYALMVYYKPPSPSTIALEQSFSCDVHLLWHLHYLHYLHYLCALILHFSNSLQSAFTHKTHMLPSRSLISVWFMAPGYSLDLLLIIISVSFIVRAKKQSQCCGKIPNICTLTQWDSLYFGSNSASVSNSSCSYAVRIVLILKGNCSHNA